MKTLRNVCIASLAGFAVGASAALLLAPDSGENTRKRLNKEMKNSRKDLKNLQKDLDNLSQKARKVIKS